MEKRGRRSPVGCWLATAALLLTVAAVAATILKPEPGLLDHAVRLANAAPWVQGFGDYFWETDHSVLTFRKQSNGVRAVSVDVGSGAETDHTTLSDDIVNGGPAVVQWRLSRDGRYLLWHHDNAPGQRWIVSDLTGVRLKSWSQQPGGHAPMWLAEGHRWLESYYSSSTAQGFIVGSTSSGCTVHDLTGIDRKCAPIPGPDQWPVGITADNQVVALQSSPPNGTAGGTIDWYSYSLTAKPVLVERHSVPMPKFAVSLVEAELSPDGDRIACLLQSTYLSPLEQMLQRLLPTWIHPHDKVGLWVIRRDGRGMRLIGAEDGGTPFGLLWTPDGKRLSFVDHDSLYAVGTGGL